MFGTNAMLRGASGIHYATVDEAQEAAELNLNAPQFIVPNGVDIAQCAVRRDECRKELCRMFPGLEHSAPLVVFFARFHIKKGPDLLLEAFAQLRREFPSAGLLLAGIRDDVVLEKSLRRRIEQKDLNGQAYVTTELVGARGAIALGGADLFVLPSRQEGFSVAVLRAMACGLPVVITDRCHFDLIARIGAGAVVGATVNEIRQGLRRVLSHSQSTLAEMGARGSALIAKEYAWGPIGERLFSIYKTIVVEQDA
jgi:glycosyltransferase involved in cell wall biosynthesis